MTQFIKWFVYYPQGYGGLNRLGVTQLNTDSLAEAWPVQIQNYPQLRKSYRFNSILCYF